MSPNRGDHDALTAMLPEAVVVWARSIGDCVSALHGEAATIVFGDADVLVGSPWIAALLRSERLYTVTIHDAATVAHEVGRSMSCATLARPLSAGAVRRAFENASSGALPQHGESLDLAFAMLLDEPMRAAGFQAMRDDLVILTKADQRSDRSSLAALKVRAHAMRTPAITLGFRRLEEACRELEEAEDDAIVALHLRRVKEEAGLVLGGSNLQTSSSRSP